MDLPTYARFAAPDGREAECMAALERGRQFSAVTHTGGIGTRPHAPNGAAIVGGVPVSYDTVYDTDGVPYGTRTVCLLHRSAYLRRYRDNLGRRVTRAILALPRQVAVRYGRMSATYLLDVDGIYCRLDS